MAVRKKNIKFAKTIIANMKNKFMQRAINLSIENVGNGGGPFGAG